MNRDVINLLRAELIGKIRDAIRPDGLVSEERCQAAVEALLAVAATVKFAGHGIPFDGALYAVAADAAEEALGRVVKAAGSPN